MGLQERADPRQQTRLLDLGEISHFFEFFFVDVHRSLHFQLVWQVIDKCIDLVDVFVVSEIDSLLQFLEQFKWNFMFLSHTFKGCKLLLVLGIGLIIICNDGCKGTASECKPNHSDYLYNSAK